MNKKAWMDYALSEGFESFEVYQSGDKSSEMTWYEGQMDTFVTSLITGTALRGVYHGKMVNMATENPDDSIMETVIGQMKEQAEAVTSEDEGVIREPMEVAVTQCTRKWKKPDEGKVKEVLSSLEKKILSYDPRMKSVTSLAFDEQTTKRSIVNSKGMNLEDETTVQLIAAEAAAAVGDTVKNDYSVKVVENLDTFDEDSYVKDLCDTILAKLDGISVASGTYRVIFEKNAMTALFTAFSGIFSGDNISKGISPLSSSCGKKIFSDRITILDDPQSADAVSPVDFDDEGCACRPKNVVKDGVFETVLHNSQTAARMHTESTGNGFKTGYSSSVGVRMMNCCIVPGEKTLEEMCKEMKEGVVITDLEGLHAGINTVTGDFSLQSSGYYVRNGQRVHSIALITVAGNFLDLLNHVTAVGNDLEWKYRRIAAPSIAFEGCALSGE